MQWVPFRNPTEQNGRYMFKKKDLNKNLLEHKWVSRPLVHHALRSTLFLILNQANN